MKEALRKLEQESTDLDVGSQPSGGSLQGNYPFASSATGRGMRARRSKEGMRSDDSTGK